MHKSRLPRKLKKRINKVLNSSEFKKDLRRMFEEIAVLWSYHKPYDADAWITENIFRPK